MFLNEGWSKEKEEYVNTMADAGFEGVFTSLHIPEEDYTKYEKHLDPLLQIVKKRGLKLIADVSGDAIQHIGLSYAKPNEIYERGFSGLRMDDGIDMATIADLSHDLTICLNASTLTEENYEQLVQKNADFNHMEAWHNYYPKPNTGLEENWFHEKNQWLKRKRFKISAFVPGDSHLRFPLYETLPTLEVHRHEHPLASALSLTQNYGVDDVYIGDPGLLKQTRRQFITYFHDHSLLLHAVSMNKQWDASIFKNHYNRMDLSRDVIRSEQSRKNHQHEAVPPNQTVFRKKGSITMDNNQYARYKGELQITKNDLPQDDKVNVIGHIMDKDVSLLPFIQSGMTFIIENSREEPYEFS